jgi:cysteine desulfurase family protein
MDNSATSFPKPACVSEAMVEFSRECGASAGRGAYAEAKACGRMLGEARARIAELINAESPERIVFTLNCSEAQNIVIRGLLNRAPEGTHAIATAMEHNSTLRPYNALVEQAGLSPEFVACDPETGLVDPADIEAAIGPCTQLVSCVHVSNVTGTLMPIDAVATVAQRHGVPCLIDAAQSVGHVPIDVQSLGADFVAFPGHKGLLGPLGTGVLYIRPGGEDDLPTMKEGGTGTVSELAVQPTSMPDKYEIGSHNAVGIAGLLAGVRWLAECGVYRLRNHDVALCEQFLNATNGVEGLRVYGPRDLSQRTGVFSVNIDGIPPGELAGSLERDFGVLTRPGIHCAPLAHETIGTHPEGTCRLSFGPFTTENHVARAAEALSLIAQQAAV